MLKALRMITCAAVALGFATGCTSVEDRGGFGDTSYSSESSDGYKARAPREDKRGGSGAPLFFTDFSNGYKTGTFSPKGDGSWTSGDVSFSGYYPRQLARRSGYRGRDERDAPTAVGQLSQVSNITVPGYIQTREKVSSGQNPNLLNVLTPYTLGDFTAETALVFYSGRPSNYDDAVDRERAIELRRRAGAGMVFRYQDPNNYYIARTGGENGIEIGKMENNQYTTLKFVETERLENYLVPERSTVLRVVGRGSQIDVYVDNNLIARVQDGTFPIGQVGLITFRIKAAYLYFSLWEDFGPNLPYF